MCVPVLMCVPMPDADPGRTCPCASRPLVGTHWTHVIELRPAKCTTRTHGEAMPTVFRGSTVRTCAGCGADYHRDFRCGLSFAQARGFFRSVDPERERRFIGRKAVLHLMGDWKRDLWAEHLRTCGAFAIDVSDRSWRVAHGHHYLVVDEDERAQLAAQHGDELTVDIDGIKYIGALDDDRVVMRASWRELHDELPATRVVVRSQRLLDARTAPLDEEVPF